MKKKPNKLKFKHACNFVANGKVFLVRCEKCNAENWAMAVAKGYCAWCGYDANSLT